MNEREARLWIMEAKKRGLLQNGRTYSDTAFKLQSDFVADTNRFLVAQCSRRAGKTNGLALRFYNTLERYPNALCVYVALTRDSAKNIMWPILQELDDRYKIGMKFTDSDLTSTHPNGAKIKLFGDDMQGFIKRLKGIKTPGCAIDEAQDFGDHIQSLVDDVLTPAMTDYKDSWLALTGTPGPIPRGYFYDVSERRMYGYSVHKWTILDNPYLPQAEEFIADMIAKRQWEPNNPTLLREWRNKWVLDVESLLIKYSEGINHYETLPADDYVYILGVDLGISDADALAVLAWSENTKNIYLVHEETTTGQGVSELAQQIRALQQRFDIGKIICDEGALGKKIAEELRRRFHLPIVAADKSRKMESVSFLNDYLRLGHFKAKKDSRFAQDSYMVQIDYDKSTPDRLVVKSSYHSDIIDAVLYAYKESNAWTYQAKQELPKLGTKDWYDKEVSDMEKEAERFFTEQEDMGTGYGYEW